MIEIDRISDTEIAPVLDLVRDSITRLAADHYSTTQIDSWVDQYPSPDEFARWRNRREMLVAREHGIPIGFGQIEINRREIVGVHVMPSRAPRGVGKQIVTALEAIGIEAGITEMVVQSSINAVEFYRHCGYQLVETIEFRLSNGAKLEAKLMHKNISLN